VYYTVFNEAYEFVNDLKSYVEVNDAEHPWKDSIQEFLIKAKNSYQ